MQRSENKDNTLAAASNNTTSARRTTSHSPQDSISRNTATVDPLAEPETGTVKFFLADKGYGFALTEDGGDIFLHISTYHAAGIMTPPRKGDPLTFLRGNGRDGRPMVAKLLFGDS